MRLRTVPITVQPMGLYAIKICMFPSKLKLYPTSRKVFAWAMTMAQRIPLPIVLAPVCYHTVLRIPRLFFLQKSILVV